MQEAGSLNWGAIAVFAVIAGSALAAVARAFRSPERLYRIYREDRARTQAAINADYIVPRLAALISEVFEGAYPAMRELEANGEMTSGQSRLLLQDNLASVEYIDSLKELSSAYDDLLAIDRYPDEASKHARRSGWALLIFVVFTVPIAVHYSWPESKLEGGLLVASAAIALIALAVTITFWLGETTSRDKLTRLFQKYE